MLVAGPTWEPHDDDVALNVATAIRDLAGSIALVRVEDGGAELTPLDVDGAVGPGGRSAGSAKLSAALATATRGDLRQSVERLKEDFDCVVVDAADPLAEAVLPVCDTALLVVSMNETRVPDVVDAAREMEWAGVRVLGALVAPPSRRTAFGSRSWVSESRRAGDATGGGDAVPAAERTSSRA